MFNRSLAVVRAASTGGRRAARPVKRTGVDKYLVSEPPKKKKEWENRGMTKDEFFVKKYSFMSDERKLRLQDKMDRQKRARQHKSEHLEAMAEKNKKNYYKKPRTDDYENPNPLNKSLLHEYVYGRYSVMSALTAKKRQLYDRLIINKTKESLDDIIKVAENFGIKIDERGSKNDLNILTDNGVHNGVVLETRKLELPVLAELGESNDETYNLVFWNDLYNQKVERQHKVIRPEGKNPLAIYLDEITDPQNVGAIIRSAYYLGVDFIITPSYNSARLGPAASKASAGALDLMDIYQVDNGLKFMRHVKQTKWAIVSTEVSGSPRSINPNDLATILDDSPVLLVLGSEGSGVRTNIKNLSDFFVSLKRNRSDTNTIVDSLNVSAATSVLLSKFFH